jgi:hypothetical protein
MWVPNYLLLEAMRLDLLDHSSAAPPAVAPALAGWLLLLLLLLLLVALPLGSGLLLRRSVWPQIVRACLSSIGFLWITVLGLTCCI